MFRYVCYNSDCHPFLFHKLIYSEAFCSTVFKITHILTHIFSSKLAVPARSTAQTGAPSSKKLC